LSFFYKNKPWLLVPIGLVFFLLLYRTGATTATHHAYGKQKETKQKNNGESRKRPSKKTMEKAERDQTKKQWRKQSPYPPSSIGAPAAAGCPSSATNHG
jgi:nitrate reductase cytochrome c-type subunit